MRINILIILIWLTVVKIESCANSGRCRVIFDNGNIDLIFNPYVGMRIQRG